MQFGINPLSIVAVRNEPCDTSEMVTQLLYGEVFKIIDYRKKWVKIRIAFDDYEGWIDTKQFQEISKESYNNLCEWPQDISNQIIDSVIDSNNQLIMIPIGSNISGCNILEHRYEGEIKHLSFDKKLSTIVIIAITNKAAPNFIQNTVDIYCAIYFFF